MPATIPRLGRLLTEDDRYQDAIYTVSIHYNHVKSPPDKRVATFYYYSSAIIAVNPEVKTYRSTTVRHMKNATNAGSAA
jgi:hypothetical protein